MTLPDSLVSMGHLSKFVSQCRYEGFSKPPHQLDIGIVSWLGLVLEILGLVITLILGLVIASRNLKLSSIVYLRCVICSTTPSVPIQIIVFYEVYFADLRLSSAFVDYNESRKQI